jgi:hypothetical protein
MMRKSFKNSVAEMIERLECAGFLSPQKQAIKNRAQLLGPGD